MVLDSLIRALSSICSKVQNNTLLSFKHKENKEIRRIFRAKLLCNCVLHVLFINQERTYRVRAFWRLVSDHLTTQCSVNKQTIYQQKICRVNLFTYTIFCRYTLYMSNKYVDLCTTSNKLRKYLSISAIADVLSIYIKLEFESVSEFIQPEFNYENCNFNLSLK